MTPSSPRPKDGNTRLHVLAGVACLCVLAGAGIGILAGRQDITPSDCLETRLSGYRFINPLLDCEIAGNPVAFRELRFFQHKIEQLIRDRTGKYQLTLVSVYFRDLMNGPWFGINEKTLFTPASLLKVPIMIACLKQAEKDPSFLGKLVPNTLREDLNQKQFVKPDEVLRPNRRYTVEQLIRRMIEYSDNNAAHLLGKTVDPKMLVRTFQDLGVKRPLLNIQYDFMSVKMYASFFRILFNASYLDRNYSQLALEYLSYSTFKDGIAAGIPPYILAAHKFGEFHVPGPENIRQRHDCGIIYYPGRPYLLCVMSRGQDYDSLDNIIREVSRTVYEEIDADVKSRSRRSAP
ncbi:MAG: class A beta-lactamase-related serine hydrolase [Nitrospirota bacterium]|nr:class A beta-lactamase-related serine hydrolase [Nitrospirota bacterium]